MPRPPSGDELIAAFADWAAGQRTRGAATSRARERSLRDQAAASATWSGLLLELAERRDGVTATVAGRRRQGRVIGVGRDFCVLESRLGRFALIRLEAISVLAPEPVPTPGPPAPTGGVARITGGGVAGVAGGGVAGVAGGSRSSGPAAGSETGTRSGAVGVPPGVATGARRPPLDLSLAAALSMLVDERAPVTIITTSGEETSGLLVALGDDVMTIQADGPARWPTYVRLDALGLCELR